MAFQPKTEPGSPPTLASNSQRNMKHMTISELVQVLRVAWQTEAYDRVEEVLIDREANLKAEIGPLKEKCEFERLGRIKAEEELKNKDEQCEKGKKAQASYEILMKEVKQNGLIDKSTIDDLRKKNMGLACENHKLMEMNKKLEADGNVVGLRKRISELKNEKLELKNKKIGLEDEMKKLFATIDKLKCEKRKLVDENIKACANFAGLLERVVKLEDDSKLLMMNERNNVGGKTKVEPQADPQVTFVVKEEVDVGDSAPFQRRKDTPKSVGAPAGVKWGLENVILIDSDDDDDDNDTTQAKMVESHKRKLSYSDIENGNSNSTSGSLNMEDLPLSSHGKFSISKKSK